MAHSSGSGALGGCDRTEADERRGGACGLPFPDTQLLVVLGSSVLFEDSLAAATPSPSDGVQASFHTHVLLTVALKYKQQSCSQGLQV